MGRKIIVDIYGGSCLYGGGVFSGKDFSKVDRSAVYAVCYVVKNLVVSGVCDKVIVQFVYVIGVIELVFVYVNMYNMSKYLSVELEKCVKLVFKFMLKGIIESLDLLRFIYLFILVYGYFG